MIKTIFARFMVVYALLLFVITLIPVYLFLRIMALFVSDIQISKTAFYTYKIWMGLYLPLIGCPVTIIGKERLQRNVLYVFIINHNSLMDIPVSTPSLPAPNKTLAKNDFLKVPIFGFIYQLCSITIDRKDLKSRANSFSAMQKTLADGFHIALYPEGTRNKTQASLLPFQDGAFKLAISTQTPIVVTVIKGTKNIISANKQFYFMPHRISIEYLSVIPTTNKEESDIKSLKEDCWQIMQQHV